VKAQAKSGCWELRVDFDNSEALLGFHVEIRIATLAVCTVELSGDELWMPNKDSVWLGNTSDLPKSPASQALSELGQRRAFRLPSRRPRPVSWSASAVLVSTRVVAPPTYPKSTHTYGRAEGRFASPQMVWFASIGEGYKNKSLICLAVSRASR
jgi:hypothetical protein